jgi:plastocyanin
MKKRPAYLFYHVSRFTFHFCLMLTVLAIQGCNQSSNPSATSAPWPPPYSGVIHGRVVFDGIAPEPTTIPGSTAKDESLLVGPQPGLGNVLGNVLVFLKNPPATNCISPLPIVLDQIGMTFVPHVIGVQAGQTLRLKSSDLMMHNVHLQCAINRDQNFGFNGPGQNDILLTEPEPPFRAKCDVHPWMTAWIGVFSHPWFAVSAKDGSFQIEHIPPGIYTLSAWHEKLPTQEQQVTVSANAPAEVTFHFQSP